MAVAGIASATGTVTPEIAEVLTVVAVTVKVVV